MATQNFKLSLIILRWLRQHQQYFLHSDMATSDNGYWNEYVKYCGTTSDPMAKSAPLANINFSKKLSRDDKDVIKNVLQFKSEEGKYGVCTSLEEWAFLILKRMFTHAYYADEESVMHWNRTSNMRLKFFISNIDFTKDGGCVPEMSASESLNTNANRFNNIPKNELVLNVSKMITNLVIKTDRKMNDNKNLKKEMGCMKNIFDATSTLTVLGNTFDKKVQYKNLSEMNQELLEMIQQNKTLTKGSQQSNTDRSDSDDDDEGKSKDEDEKEIIDNNSTDTEQLSGSKNKKGLIMSVDNAEDSNSSEDDNRTNNGE
jgi:hypothetical protein